MVVVTKSSLVVSYRVSGFPSSSMSEQVAQALVFVYLEAGVDTKEDSLNDVEWSQNEDAVFHLAPGFVTATRYKNVNSQAPTWLVLCDVEAPAPEHNKILEAHGSTTLSTISGLSRRAYTLLGTSSRPETTAEDLPGKYVLVVSFEIAPENEDDFNKWYDEEHMGLVSQIPGWKRGRRYKLVGYQNIPGQFMADQPVSKYLAIHELDNNDFEQSAEIKHARGTEWARRVMQNAIRREVRAFELHKVYTGQPK
ncbi:hypothetical protein FB451DRAFT_1251762 [Mycena latifolia]|nr:hypothetical protein FB451DRAFT_1251762 [Mycena latifolia]